MTTQKRIAGSVRSLLRASVLLAGTFLPFLALAQGPDPLTTTRFYYSEGTRIPIEVQPDRWAVHFQTAASPVEWTAAVARNDRLESAELIETIDFANLQIYRLSSGVPAAELTTTAAELMADPAIDFASPIFEHKGEALILRNRLFLQLREGSSEDVLATLLDDFGLDLAERTFWSDRNFVLTPRPGSTLDVIDVCWELLGREEVEFCHPNFLSPFQRESAPNDSLYGRQWNLDNTAQPPQQLLWAVDADLDAAEAWEIQPGISAVKIAVLDDGVDMDHPDLMGSIDTADAYDFIDGDNNPEPGSAGDTHGTRCIGLAAAIPNNGAGVAGVAGGARILPIRIASGGWVDNGAAANGIGHAYLKGADVLSCSWGGGTPFDQSTAAIRNAVVFGRGGRGCVVVFAAGNDVGGPGQAVVWPAYLPETMGVAATSPCDERKNLTSCDGETWSSNFGPELDVAAPGVLLPTTDLGGGYFLTFNGTSAAVPQVAGLAALLIAQYPSWEGAEIRARIQQSCDQVGSYAYGARTGKCNDLGFGRINMYRALSGKPQVKLGPLDDYPSVYRDDSDAPLPYPLTHHDSAAYEWLGEEFSPEKSAGDSKDPDGVPNTGGRDAFDDGVTFYPPYLPGQIGHVDVRISVEDPQSERYSASPDSVFINIWLDWKSDGSWNTTYDWVIKNHREDPRTWGGARSRVIALSFVVPDTDIDWHIQNQSAGRFLNARTRVSYRETPANASADLKWGEVEDDRFINFVEMFDTASHYLSEDPAGCPDAWGWWDGPQPWMPPSCPPPFIPDAAANGYLASSWYLPSYDGDADDRMSTPSFDFSEMTEAFLMLEETAVEALWGDIVVYVSGVRDSVILHQAGIPTTPPACGLVIPVVCDLSSYCGDGFDDIQIAFESFRDNPCGTVNPDEQDWLLDNVVVWAVDSAAPATKFMTVTPTDSTTATVTWEAPGDDGVLRTAELYNLRYGPRLIDARDWRHALWVRHDMVPALPQPSPPGTMETVAVTRLSGGQHHFALRTLDEVNNLSGYGGGGTNRPPDQTVPGTITVTEGDTISFQVTATDPDHDPLMLYLTQAPNTVIYADDGQGTGSFLWITQQGDFGQYDLVFVARDWNGATDRDTTTVRVLPPVAPDFDDHDNGNFVFSVTDQGILGFLDQTQNDGSGFVYPRGGANHLFIGSVWLGESTSYVANRDYDLDPTPEWRVTQQGGISKTQNGDTQTIFASYSDSAGAQPRGLVIGQESRTVAAPTSDDDFTIVTYTVTNQGGAPLSDLYLGAFLDFDIAGSGGDDQGKVDTSRDLVYLSHSSGIHTGVRLLQKTGQPIAPANLTLISNRTYVWPNQYITDADKYGLLSAASSAYVLTDASTDDDYSTLVSVGPFDLAAGGSYAVSVAVIGGNSLAELEQNSDRAQTIFGALTSDAPEIATARVTQLLPNRPNPFPSETIVSFELEKNGEVALDLFDVGGRLVRRLAQGNHAAGPHEVRWNGRDESGHLMRSGVYFLRMVAASREQSRRILLMR